MAQFAANPQRFDPYKNFKFRVKWDGETKTLRTKYSSAIIVRRTTPILSGLHHRYARI